MKSRVTRQFRGISLVAALLLSGCAAIFNPYNETFDCHSAPGGKCAPTPEIYAEDIAASKKVGHKIPVAATGTVQDGQEAADPSSATAAESAYREAQFDKMTKLLKQPVTPVVVPPAVMRILYFPFEGEDGELNMPSYTYIMLDKPKWVMGNYLVQQPEGAN